MSGIQKSYQSPRPQVFLINADIDLIGLGSANIGDYGVISATKKSFVLKQLPASNSNNWIQVSNPSGSSFTTHSVVNESEMLDLSTANVGDYAIRLDLNNSYYLLIDSNYADLANWIRIQYKWNVYGVADEAAMLALTNVKNGDFAIRNDIEKTFILIDDSSPSDLGSWQLVLTPGTGTINVGTAANLDSTACTKGTIAICGDTGYVYRLSSDDYTQIADWLKIGETIPYMLDKLPVVTCASLPSTADIAENKGGFYKDNSTGLVYAACNVGGIILSVQLLDLSV